MTRQSNGWLVLGGVLSATACVLHLAIIVGGPAWYRFFGAGEAMARSAARGSCYPPVLTTLIAAVLALSAAYLFSGAGLVLRLPALRVGLVAISGVYLLRGLAIVPVWALFPEQVNALLIWSSLIVFIYGSIHVIGLVRSWQTLGQ